MDRELLTFSAGICLHELRTGASLIKFGGQPCQLGQNLVDDADLGCQIVLVDVEGQEASNVAQASDDEDRGLLRHGEPMEGRKRTGKGGSTRTSELLRMKPHRSDVAFGSGEGGNSGEGWPNRVKSTDGVARCEVREVRGANGPSVY